MIQQDQLISVKVGLRDSMMIVVSDLAVLQVRVNVLDQGIIRVTDRKDDLAQRAAPHITLFLCLYPQL